MNRLTTDLHAHLLANAYTEEPSLTLVYVSRGNAKRFLKCMAVLIRKHTPEGVTIESIQDIENFYRHRAGRESLKIQLGVETFRFPEYMRFDSSTTTQVFADSLLLDSDIWPFKKAKRYVGASVLLGMGILYGLALGLVLSPYLKNLIENYL